jgi:hypothetical protein
MCAGIHRLRNFSPPRVVFSEKRLRKRGMIRSLFAMMLAGCSPLSGPNLDQAGNGPGTYSISTMYDGSVGARAHASEWLDNDAKNLCRSPYKLISEKSISNVNHIGEVTSSRLVWTVTCERPAEASP